MKNSYVRCGIHFFLNEGNTTPSKEGDDKFEIINYHLPNLNQNACIIAVLLSSLLNFSSEL